MAESRIGLPRLRCGAIQAANVLASPQAVEMGIFVVRAFVRMRELASVHADLAKSLSG